MTKIKPVLIGDSIFDNDRYVPGEKGVIDQLKEHFPDAVKLAVDGSVIADVAEQLKKLPNDTTHVFVSAGGNDLILNEHKLIVDDEPLVEVIEEWCGYQYRKLLETLAPVLKRDLKVTLLVVYDKVPDITPGQAKGVQMWNSFVRRFSEIGDVISIDELLTENEDYSAMSPIEPSAKGGQKIVDAIVSRLSEASMEKEQC